MTSQTYLEKLKAAQEANQSWLCIGLDPQPERLPIQATHLWDEPVLPFCKAIIDATLDIASAYKPNLGFFLQWGAAGMIAMERVIRYIPRHIPIIVDCKAGDIGHTQAAWAAGLLDEWGVDAFVINPFVGEDAVASVINTRPDKGVYVLTRTSNGSAPDFQGDFHDENSLSRQVLRKLTEWQTNAEGAIGSVMGATYPGELELARELAPSVPFLIPGIGSQGGNLEMAVRAGADQVAGPLISASRSVIYAGNGYDFAEKARAVADDLRAQINRFRSEKVVD